MSKHNVVGDSVIDLYSGVGTFSVFVEAKRVIAVERSKRCLAFAKKNAQHSDFYTGNVVNLRLLLLLFFYPLNHNFLPMVLFIFDYSWNSHIRGSGQ